MKFDLFATSDNCQRAHDLCSLLQELGIHTDEMLDHLGSIADDYCEHCEWSFDYCECTSDYKFRYIREYDDGASLED